MSKWAWEAPQADFHKDFHKDLAGPAGRQENVLVLIGASKRPSSGLALSGV